MHPYSCTLFFLQQPSLPNSSVSCTIFPFYSIRSFRDSSIQVYYISFLQPLFLSKLLHAAVVYFLSRGLYTTVQRVDGWWKCTALCLLITPTTHCPNTSRCPLSQGPASSSPSLHLKTVCHTYTSQLHFIVPLCSLFSTLGPPSPPNSPRDSPTSPCVHSIDFSLLVILPFPVTALSSL